MTAAITLNGIEVVSLRLVTPMKGPWFADLVLMPEAPALPPGPATIVIAGTGDAPVTLVGFIDPKAQGLWGPRASCRVVGGANGWQASVLPQDFHNDAGLLLSTVIAATAAEVLERATVIEDDLITSGHYMRAAGPASSVLEGLDWHVDYTGTTIVGPRVPVPVDPTAIFALEYDPTAQRVTLGTDGTLVQPGAVLIDQRFGSLSVVDVEQTWTAEGVRATAWCGSSGPGTTSRLAGQLASFVRLKAGVASLKIYRYRIVLQGADGRLQLQLVSPTDGQAPVTLPVDVWPGMSGLSAQLTLGSEVLLAFEAGDPKRPHVVSFSGAALPLVLILDATTLVKVGAAAVKPVALAPDLETWAAAVVTACAGASPPITIPPLPASVAATKLVAI